MWVVTKPARGRPRRFAEAVGCADCPAMLATLAWRISRYALARCAQTDAPSRLLMRAARAARLAALSLRFSAPHQKQNFQVVDLPVSKCVSGPNAGRRQGPGMLTGASRPAPHRLRGDVRCVRRRTDPASSRRAVPGRGDFCGDEEHSPGVGARSALRPHACRVCPSAARQRVASYAARPRGAHRSGVGPQDRPPQHEPPPGTARRDAPIFAAESSLSRTAATRQQQSRERAGRQPRALKARLR